MVSLKSFWARAKKEQREEERRAKQAERDARLAQEKQEHVDDQARLSRLHELRTSVEDEQEAELSGTPDTECHQAVHDTFGETQDMFSSGDEDSAGDDSEEYEEWNGFSDDEDEEPNEAGIDYVAADFNDDDEHGYENVWHGDIDQEIDRLASTMMPADAKIPSANPLDIPHESEKTAAASNDTRRGRRASWAPRLLSALLVTSVPILVVAELEHVGEVRLDEDVALALLDEESPHVPFVLSAHLLAMVVVANRDHQRMVDN
ncbi:hypothetical protein M409DRAFT_15741 [Zasmidium cellare ATCC 36951]|uniref:Uncharacterized protein n=1 Tax=Zasmidium cellare ATCC 36951 TaxID=1080233 RepID=A0A6A6D5P1_ZASCE|nr:uncharacterized protein M409DRAFT_15741 [Zasmidium cellare ATCC 36951]KAF2173459.1 hypothetical protein M409DRAFT_15741 [Zasmidium cellare ATCC 36951]